MENFSLEEFVKIKEQSEKIYKEVGVLSCPALSADVHFTSEGFHHLQFDGSRSERPKQNQKTKMLCLRDAIKILKKTTTMQEYRSVMQPTGKPDRGGFRATKQVEYFAFEAVTDTEKARRIKVIVRRVGDGYYHFWSVMPTWFEDKKTGQPTIRTIGGSWMIDV